MISEKQKTQTMKTTNAQEMLLPLNHHNLFKNKSFQAVDKKMENFKQKKNSIAGGHLRKTQNCAVILGCIILMIGLLVTATSAQSSYDTSSTSHTTPGGIAPGSPSGSYSLSGFETINPYSGKLNFNLPLLSIGGRGRGGYVMSLQIQQNWEIEHHVEDPNAPCPPSGPRCLQYDVTHTYMPVDHLWSQYQNQGTSPGTMTGRQYGDPRGGGPCSGNFSFSKTLTHLTFIKPDGSEIEFRDTLNGGKAMTPSNCNPVSRGTEFVSVDGSFATFVSNTPISDVVYVQQQNAGMQPSGILKWSDGTVYQITGGQVTKIADKDGNFWSFDYSQGPVQVTDSLGRVFNGTSYTRNNPAGGTVTRSVQITQDSLSNRLRSGYTIKGLYDLFPVANSNSSLNVSYNPSVISSVILPDSRKYEFFYNSYGELAEVILPTGGTIQYDWQESPGLLGNASEQSGGDYTVYRRIEKRRVYNSNHQLQSETIYQLVSPAPAGEPGTPITIIDESTYDSIGASPQLLNKTRHFYYGNASPSPFYNKNNPVTDQPYNEGREYKTEIYDSDGSTLLRKVENVYQPGAPLAANPTADINGRIAETTTTLADTNQVAKQTFSYDQFNNQTDVYEYDYGTGAAGDFKRRTHADYVSNSNYTSFSGAHMRHLPAQTWVSSDSAGNSKASLAQMEYDSYASDANHASLLGRSNVVGFDAANYGTGNPWRGNVTAMTSYANAATQTDPATIYSQYDVLGNVVKTINAKGNASTISYDDNFGAPDGEARTNSAPSQLNGQSTFAFATSATNALGWVTGHAQFDYFTGAAVDSEDINGVVSSSFYNDVLDRPTQAIIANNIPSLRQQTTIAYDDTNHKVTVTSDLNTFGDNSLKSESLYDGLGRTTESRKYEAGGGYIATLTEYDALGRVKRATNPYRPAQNEPQVWTTSVYDALGRVTSVTMPDNAVAQTAYSGNVVTATDQAGKQRRSITNALGQLKRVDEPDDSGNLGSVTSPNQPTNYLYDTSGKMVKVTQGVQSRYFKYDSLGRLLRVRQPEQGVNANLSLADAITGNSDWSAGFTYDANSNMLTAIDTKGTTITSSYDALNRVLSRNYSDNTPQVTYTYDDPNIQYSKGRLTKTSNSVSASQILSLDVIGRVLASRQTTDGQNYDSAYSYNLGSALLEETYPSGRKVKNSFQSDGNLAKIETLAPGGSYQTRADNFAYAAHGAISQLQIGSGKWETAQFNNRLQVTQLGLGNSSSDQSLWKLNYDFGTTDNNGNVKAQTLTAPNINPLAQNYTYDSLSRLKSVTETQSSAQTFRQTFTYDRYGNRSFDAGNTTTLGSCPANECNPTFDANTNRITSAGYTYDLSGNIIVDSQGRQFTFNGDNKQTQVKDASNNVIGTYFYDGDGKRIKKVTNQETTTFVYSGGKLVGEYLLTSATPQSPTTQYITTDMLGSPRVISDGAGNIVSRRDFMPFGEELNGLGNRSASNGYNADSIRQKFTGYERDNETNLDFAEARYYNSAVGRFTAVDPLLASGKSANPQTFNRYAYAMNNPVISTDPSGMQAGSFGGQLSSCQTGARCDGSFTNGGVQLNNPLATVNVNAGPSSLLEAGAVTMGTSIVPLPTTADFEGDPHLTGLRNEENIARSTPLAMATGGAFYNAYAGINNLVNDVVNLDPLLMYSGYSFGHAPLYEPSTQAEANIYNFTSGAIAAAALLSGNPEAAPESFTGFSTTVVPRTTFIGTEPGVIGEGSIIMEQPKYEIPKHFVENPNRAGSYGTGSGSNYVERIRIDAATPKYPTHYHIDRGKPHLFPRSSKGDPGFPQN